MPVEGGPAGGLAFGVELLVDLLVHLLAELAFVAEVLDLDLSVNSREADVYLWVAKDKSLNKCNKPHEGGARIYQQTSRPGFPSGIHLMLPIMSIPTTTKYPFPHEKNHH